LRDNQLCCDRNKGGKGFEPVVGDLREETKELISEWRERNATDVEFVAFNECEQESIRYH